VRTSEVFFSKIEKKDLRGLFVLLLLAAGCGRKGDPLAPLRPVPNVVAGVSARRAGDRIELRFTLPSANQDGSKPVALERVDVYARSVPEASPPLNEQIIVQIIDRQNLVGSVHARPPESDKPPKPGVEPPKDDRPAAGDPVLLVDKIPPGPPAPLPPPKRPPPPAFGVPPANPLTPAAPPLPATRYLMIVAVSPKGHAGRPTPIAVPLTPPSAPPTDVKVTNDETTLKLVWQPGAEHQSFRVYEVDAGGKEAAAGLLTPSPLGVPEYSEPVEFGKERCLAVRGVELRGNVAIETEATAPKCTTPIDTFPPPVPANLEAVADTGFVTLTWDAVKAPDLGGYLVLRGEGSNDRLQQLTSEPITQTAYKDTTVRPGVTYYYAVVAIDQSTPANRSAASALKTVTAK
jgi:hypothetical protein